MTNNLLSLMDDAMGELGQSDVWHELVKKDPFIQRAEKEADPLWQELKQADRDMFFRLSDAVTSLLGAYQDIAMCFGMQIAEAYRFAANNPLALSQHIYNRVYGSP